MDIWFIHGPEGYYSGHTDKEVFWLEGRKGAVTFRTRDAAEERIAELGLEDVEAEEY